jgi:outer membrane protein OmpA-like peptidoglycan-associated protein
MVTRRTKDGWAMPQAIHITDMNPRGNVIDFAFGPDQRTLILSMQHDSSMGGQDLFVCFLDEKNNTWTKPLWLGSTVNSRYNEITPFLAADGKTLYFSSDRPGGTGELDVWRAERLDESWQRWSSPEHLDQTINRPGRTSYYSEDAEGKYCYFVWRRNVNDQTDIYRSPAPKRIVPVVLLSGVVRDETGAPVDATIRYERLSDGKTLGLAHSDPATGAYQITLSAGESYSLFAEQRGYLPTSESFDARNVKAFSTVKKDLMLVKIKENAVVRLNNIFFETDKAALLQESFAELNRLAEVMRKDTTLRVSIEGHTDSTGSAEHNRKLSEARANAVVDYLISQTVASNRLEAHGYGSERPIDNNATEEGRSRNRRVEFRILAK